MTRLNRLPSRATTASRARERRAAHRPAREARTGRSFDGVVASYIRELSAAETPRPEPEQRRELRGS